MLPSAAGLVASVPPSLLAEASGFGRPGIVTTDQCGLAEVAAAICAGLYIVFDSLQLLGVGGTAIDNFPGIGFGTITHGLVGSYVSAGSGAADDVSDGAGAAD